MFPRIRVNGRLVDRITSEEGRLHYYDHLKYWRTCVVNTNPVISPTIPQALEYQELKNQKGSLAPWGDLEERKRYRKLQLYDSRYDWRPQLSGSEGKHGLVHPDGREILPEYFADVFTQFDAVNQPPAFIPVSDGEAWGLVAVSSHPILVKDFIYSAIIPERWEGAMYFVQDRATMKWGALGVEYPQTNISKHTYPGIPLLVEVMPPIADEIFGDELLGDCAPTCFWMTKTGDKVGILTPYGYTEIKYDTYETDDERFLFRMICRNKPGVDTFDYNFFKYTR